MEVVFPRVTVGNEHRVLLASAGISRETVSNDSRIIAPEERFRSAEVFGSEFGESSFSSLILSYEIPITFVLILSYRNKTYFRKYDSMI